MTETAKLTASDGVPGDALGLSVDLNGATIVAGAGGASVQSMEQQGAAYVFAEPPGGWADATQTAKLTASDGQAFAHFGTSVTVNGKNIVVGAPEAVVGSTDYEGAAYVFQEPVTGWRSSSRFSSKETPSDGQYDEGFGWFDALRAGSLAVGAPFPDNSSVGIVYVFAE